jgi:DNA-directed RNA polymerase specialized sigma24 family protein
LRAGLRELSPPCQQLLAMLITDPPRSYAEISTTMGIPIGSIGPRRARCLECLRRSAALEKLGTGGPRVNSAGGETRA